MHALLLGIFPGEGLLSHRIPVYRALEGTAKRFSKVVVLISAPTSRQTSLYTFYV